MDLAPIDWFDLPAIGYEWRNTSSRVLKRRYVKDGYDKMLSFYGAVKDHETLELKGIRIEVLSRTDYQRDEINHLYDFYLHTPLWIKYSIWLFNSIKQTITLVGAYP